jgi:hypothetical protein
MPAYDIERLKQRIAGRTRFEDNPALVRQKSSFVVG